MPPQVCYYCGRPASTVEHVPPKCLFPERKDSDGTDYRKGLITVPACDEHNLGKSKDDEFLMACLTPVVGNSAPAFVQTHSKLRRAYERTEGRLLASTLSDRQNQSIVTSDGTAFPVLMGRPDLPRLCRSLESVARGLYFHEKKEPFRGRCTVLPAFVSFPMASALEVVKTLSRRMMNDETSDRPKEGMNPAIFWYRMGAVDQFGLVPLLMTFFEYCEVLAAFQPEGVSLPHRTLDDSTPQAPLRIDIVFG